MPNRLKIPLVVISVVAGVFILWFGVHSAHRVETKRYPMTGRVVSVEADQGSARVHTDNIPGFMQPMDMEYKIPDRGTLSRLKPGDKIKCTLASNRQDLWELRDISILPPAPQP